MPVLTALGVEPQTFRPDCDITNIFSSMNALYNLKVFSLNMIEQTSTNLGIIKMESKKKLCVSVIVAIVVTTVLGIVFW